MSQPFTLKARLKSFTFAINGILEMIKTQHNAWIHLGITIVVCAAGLFFRVSLEEWRWLLTAIAMVCAAEAMNTAFEHLCDLLSPEFHASVQKSKDIAAGAVLIAAIGAALIGASVFWPYLTR